MPILTSAEYPAIRAAIDTSLDSALLSDAVIGLSIYLGAADLEVKQRDPSWATRTGDELTHLTNAAIYLTAARLVPVIPNIIAETFTDHDYRREKLDVAALVADLRAKAAEELAAITEPNDTTPSRPTMFTLARGRRGW